MLIATQDLIPHVDPSKGPLLIAGFVGILVLALLLVAFRGRR